MGPERASVNYTRATDATNLREARQLMLYFAEQLVCEVLGACAPSFGHPQCRPCTHATRLSCTVAPRLAQHASEARQRTPARHP
eukprot:1802050-Prymnesium_polylepis.1